MTWVLGVTRSGDSITSGNLRRQRLGDNLGVKAEAVLVELGGSNADSKNTSACRGEMAWSGPDNC